MNNKIEVTKTVLIPTKNILLGIMKAYTNISLSMLIKAKIDTKKYKKNNKLGFPNDFVETYAFLSFLYKRLAKKITKEKSFEIIRVALMTTGFSIQQTNFRSVEQKRTFENLIKYQQIANKEGSTKLNTMVVLEQTDKVYRFKVTRCVFYELFNALEVPELTGIMCSIDNAIFNTYLPDEVVFSRGVGNTILSGKKECEFIIRKVT
jgi:hypothetical protein